MGRTKSHAHDFGECPECGYPLPPHRSLAQHLAQNEECRETVHRNTGLSEVLK